MRVFFALPVPEEIEHECLHIIKEQQTQPHHEEVRWTHRDHLHITLRFLSEITEEQLAQFTTILPEKIAQCAAVPIESRKLILFPPRNPHLFAMSIHLNKELADLYRVINDVTLSLGFPEERHAFVPHITLGRFKHVAVADQFRMHTRSVVSSEANQVVLFQSEPNDKGSTYTKLLELKLAREESPD